MFHDKEPPRPPCRTYYSETLTGNAKQNEFLNDSYTNGPSIKMCNLWLLKSCTFAPIIKELTVSGERAFLEPVENWVTFGSKPIVCINIYI